ncbi:dihydropteroate synthase [Alysiella filiformis]|uniref:Dihydropteroate synthase n=1 Tax=Alysiella filiformis DSM 16848 TaxID=1120981 RepID=A0A286E4Z6_9NEIS|nr:dihydropteroate synthase [Alysiella filiformis]QMT30444.1 dihydropteroate synthase [Alysiella filiformis]UBQ56575.1 dihydropteroate synthase [Alysiella filiformis DSM 16848]SOD65931.1 dihydropteroate synthase [Alysiella filiformis DSM 16848]
MLWQTQRFQIDLSSPKIMGIVNVTPDSFSDGGQYSGSLKTALAHAEKLLLDGADILDIGGESTRPNALPVSPDEEWSRVAPILDELSKWQVPISLDTRRTVIIQRALDKNALDIVNDVQALEDVGAVDLVAQSGVGVCLMHMKGLPENMQNNPNYQDVVREVADYLGARVGICVQAGMALNRIVLDVGLGFGKNLAHNIALLQNLDKLSTQYNLPHLVGVSRKRMIGEITGREMPCERVSGSVAAALFAVERGAKIVRVHDVRETADALKVWQKLHERIV